MVPRWWIQRARAHTHTHTGSRTLFLTIENYYMESAVCNLFGIFVCVCVRDTTQGSCNHIPLRYVFEKCLKIVRRIVTSNTYNYQWKCRIKNLLFHRPLLTFFKNSGFVSWCSYYLWLRWNGLFWFELCRRTHCNHNSTDNI